MGFLSQSYKLRLRPQLASQRGRIAFAFATGGSVRFPLLPHPVWRRRRYGWLAPEEDLYLLEQNARASARRPGQARPRRQWGRHMIPP